MWVRQVSHRLWAVWLCTGGVGHSHGVGGQVPGDTNEDLQGQCPRLESKPPYKGLSRKKRFQLY